MLVQILKLILRPIFYLILSILGWKIPPQEHLAESKGKNQHNVIIFSHTTRMDFFLSAMYTLAQPEYGNGTYVLLMPGIYNKFTTPILNRLSFIKATHSREKGQGLVDRIIAISKTIPQMYIGLSPEGTLVSSPWKAGYYWMGKGMKVEMPEKDINFKITGFDYIKKELVFYSKVPVPEFDKTEYNQMSKEQKNEHFKEEKERIESELKVYMARVIPLYPDCSYIKVDDHDPKLISIVNFFKIFLCGVMFYLTFSLFSNYNSIILLMNLITSIYFCICENVVYYTDLGGRLPMVIFRYILYIVIMTYIVNIVMILSRVSFSNIIGYTLLFFAQALLAHRLTLDFTLGKKNKVTIHQE